MSIQEIIEYVVHTPNNPNPAVLRDMLEQLGGGGSGDFSIATLTLTVTGTGAYDKATITGAILDEDMLVRSKDYEVGTHQIQIVMYKTSAYCIIEGNTAYPDEVSGNATIVQGNEVLITGDCAASIEGKGGK